MSIIYQPPWAANKMHPTILWIITSHHPFLISSVRRWFEEEAGVDGYESLDNYKENNDDLYDGFLAEELLDNHNTSLNYESDQGVNLMKWYLMLM